jgi:hypothetical protein
MVVKGREYVTNVRTGSEPYQDTAISRGIDEERTHTYHGTPEHHRRDILATKVDSCIIFRKGKTDKNKPSSRQATRDERTPPHP